MHTLFGLGLTYLRIDDPVWCVFVQGLRFLRRTERRTIVPMQLPPELPQVGFSVDSKKVGRQTVTTYLIRGHPKPRLLLVLLRKHNRNLLMMIKIRVKGHDLLSERTNVPLLASARRSQGPSKMYLPSLRRGAERLDPRRRAAHVDSTSQFLHGKWG